MQLQTHLFQVENDFVIGSEEELGQSFRIRDQKKLLVPDDLEFPLRVNSYLAWSEPSEIYTYLIFKRPNWDLPRGVAFKKITARGEPTGGLCSWCHSYGSSEEIGLMSVTMSPNVSQSYFLCYDLSCIHKIEEGSARAGKHPEKSISDLYIKIEKLFEGMANYRLD